MWMAEKFKCTLVVDDDPISCFINQKIIELTAITQHVKIVHNGEEALKFIWRSIEEPLEQRVLPDLIFLDLNMPVMNGFEFLSVFQDLPKTYRKEVKIVVLTSSNNIVDRNRAKHFNVERYINKPLTIESARSLLR